MRQDENDIRSRVAALGPDGLSALADGLGLLPPSLIDPRSPIGTGPSETPPPPSPSGAAEQHEGLTGAARFGLVVADLPDHEVDALLGGLLDGGDSLSNGHGPSTDGATGGEGRVSQLDQMRDQEVDTLLRVLLGETGARDAVDAAVSDTDHGRPSSLGGALARVHDELRRALGELHLGSQRRELGARLEAERRVAEAGWAYDEAVRAAHDELTQGVSDLHRGEVGRLKEIWMSVDAGSVTSMELAGLAHLTAVIAAGIPR